VQRSENPHSERADPTRTYGPEYTPGEREALKTGDATRYIAEQQAVSPVMQRLAAARERALVEQNARLNERLRLFNEAMQPDPDPMITDLQRLRLEEEAEARRDPWKAPGVALRQMRQELNDIHAQRDAADLLINSHRCWVKNMHNPHCSYRGGAAAKGWPHA
jgi:hypothetical protein